MRSMSDHQPVLRAAYLRRGANLRMKRRRAPCCSQLDGNQSFVLLGFRMACGALLSVRLFHATPTASAPWLSLIA